jgi:hypothetical protein
MKNRLSGTPASIRLRRVNKLVAVGAYGVARPFGIPPLGLLSVITFVSISGPPPGAGLTTMTISRPEGSIPTTGRLET